MPLTRVFLYKKKQVSQNRYIFTFEYLFQQIVLFCTILKLFSFVSEKKTVTQYAHLNMKYDCRNWITQMFSILRTKTRDTDIYDKSCQYSKLHESLDHIEARYVDNTY